MNKINKTMVSFAVIVGMAFVPGIVMAEAEPSTSPAPTPAPTSAPEVVTPSVTVGAVSSSAGTPSTGDGSSSAGASLPSTGGSSSSAGTPSTGGSSSSAGTSVPSTGGSSSSAGLPSVGGSSSSAGPAPVPTPSNNTPNGGSSSGTSYSSSGSSIYNRYYLSYAARTGNKCPFITTYMKRGWANSPAEVTKLQNFLKDYEKMTITVNGIYDLATENAVKQFQAKYLDTVMGPWGANQPSGVVYITTTRKINELACNIPMYLTVKEALEIQAYRNRPVVTASAQSTVPSSTTASPTIENTSDTNVAPTVDNSASSTPVGPSPIIGTDDSTDNTNTAAVTKANILQRFWNFLKSIF